MSCSKLKLRHAQVQAVRAALPLSSCHAHNPPEPFYEGASSPDALLPLPASPKTRVVALWLKAALPVSRVCREAFALPVKTGCQKVMAE